MGNRRYHRHARRNRDVKVMACAELPSSSSDRSYDQKRGAKFTATRSRARLNALRLGLQWRTEGHTLVTEILTILFPLFEHAWTRELSKRERGLIHGRQLEVTLLAAKGRSPANRNNNKLHQNSRFIPGQDDC
jgi:hypothetical protein